MGRGFRQARRSRAATITRRLRIDLLEERQLLSNVFTVTNTLDDGSTGSLRWAITQVDGDASDSAASPDQIQFNIPQNDPGYSAGVWTIKPKSNLPVVANPVVIDGYTQAGASPNTNGPGSGDNATLTVVLNGTQVESNQGALLDLQSSSVVVRGLLVERYGTGSGTGILIEKGNDDVIAGDFIGTDGTSNTLTGNANAGVMIVNGNGNTIGGTTPDTRNVISNNGYTVGTGVILDGGQDNVVAGNFIGTDATGTVALPNGQEGILIEAGSGNTIGGTTPAARNIIAGRKAYGTGDAYDAVGIGTASQNVVEGNFIGTDVTGTVALPAGSSTQPFGTVGVDIGGDLASSASGNTIGGTAAGAGNVISGWGQQGILIGSFDGPAPDTVIEGNLIGTDATGLTSLGNGIGIEVQSPDTTIGGTTAGARNVISGNNRPGVVVSNGFAGEGSAVGVLIEGNYIGTDANGRNALPNQIGVEFEDVQDCTIGGTALGAGNVIGGNAGDGVMIVANPNQPTAKDNWIAGNLIGTDATGQDPLGNGANGVFLSGTTPTIVGPTNFDDGEVLGNTIGGTVAAAGNVIAFNRVDGVAIVDSNQNGGPIEENSIYDNGKLGIDLGGTGVPLINGDGGRYYPYLTGESLSPGSTSTGGTTTTITGTLNGNPYSTARIELFSNPTPDPSGFGQGKTYLGSLDVTPNNEDGVAPFTFTYNGDLTGQFVTATATDAGGNTSEFSPDIPPAPQGPTIALTATPNPALSGQTVTVTIFLPVQPLYVGNTAIATSVTPTGNVALFVDGQDYQDPVALQPGVNAQGVAGIVGEVTVPKLGAGTHVITAHYDGGSFPPANSAPLTVTVVNNLTAAVGLSVSPDPTAFGQPVTFSAAVTSLASVPGQSLPAPGGFVDLREGTVTLARVALDATGHAAFTTTALPVGAQDVTAFYEGDAIYAAATSNTVTAFIDPTEGPTVLSVQRYGLHAQPTSIVVTFSQPLDAASAQNPNNYQITGPGGRPIRVNFAVYDGAADTVTLTPAHNLSLYLHYRLTINGSAPNGVADAYGNLLDGAGMGNPGSNFVTTLTARNLVLGHQVPAGPRRIARPRTHTR